MASFVTIPIEARTSVYEYLLSGITLSPKPVARRTRNATKAAVGPYPAPLNLYLVNKQVFLEASRVFLRFVTIRLKSRDQLQVLARQPLIANLIIDRIFATGTNMLTNDAATSSVGALAHLKSITFELVNNCAIGQSLKDATVRPLKPPHTKLAISTSYEPSRTCYDSLRHRSWPQPSVTETRKIMERLMQMVSSGLNVVFAFRGVSFWWREDSGRLVRVWSRYTSLY